MTEVKGNTIHGTASRVFGCSYTAKGKEVKIWICFDAWDMEDNLTGAWDLDKNYVNEPKELDPWIFVSHITPEIIWHRWGSQKPEEQDNSTCGDHSFSLQLTLDWEWTQSRVEMVSGMELWVLPTMQALYLTTAGLDPDIVNLLVISTEAELLRYHYTLERPAMD